MIALKRPNMEFESPMLNNEQVDPRKTPGGGSKPQKEIDDRLRIIPQTQRPFRYWLDLVWHLAQREFILRYKGSAMGILWILAGPLMQLLMLVFVFKKVLPLDIDSYPAFVFTGLLPWTWFSTCITNSGMLFTSNRDLIKRPNFPPVILIAVNIISNLFIYLTVLPMVILTLLFSGHSLGWTLCLVPLLVLIEGILICGISIMIATWNVFYRDIQQIAGIFITLLFWITPVFYRSHAVSKEYQFLFDFNPMSVLVNAYHDIMFYGVAPHWNLVLISASISIAIVAGGYTVYLRQLHNMIDAL